MAPWPLRGFTNFKVPWLLPSWPSDRTCTNSLGLSGTCSTTACASRRRPVPVPRRRLGRMISSRNSCRHVDALSPPFFLCLTLPHPLAHLACRYTRSTIALRFWQAIGATFVSSRLEVGGRQTSMTGYLSARNDQLLTTALHRLIQTTNCSMATAGTCSQWSLSINRSGHPDRLYLPFSLLRSEPNLVIWGCIYSLA